MQRFLELSCAAPSVCVCVCVCTVYSTHLIFALVVPGRTRPGEHREGLCFACAAMFPSPRVGIVQSIFPQKTHHLLYIREREKQSFL